MLDLPTPKRIILESLFPLYVEAVDRLSGEDWNAAFNAMLNDLKSRLENHCDPKGGLVTSSKEISSLAGLSKFLLKEKHEDLGKDERLSFISMFKSFSELVWKPL